MCACLYLYIYDCVCVCVYVYECVSLCIFECVCVCVCVCIYMSVCVPVCVYMSVCVFLLSKNQSICWQFISMTDRHGNDTLQPAKVKERSRPCPALFLCDIPSASLVALQMPPLPPSASLLNFTLSLSPSIRGGGVDWGVRSDRQDIDRALLVNNPRLCLWRLSGGEGWRRGMEERNGGEE